MKNTLSLWLVPLLIMLAGCSTRVSTHHRHHNHEVRHHNHVSVGVHGRGSGARVLGALIVGGIISSIIHDHQHHDEEQHDPEAEQELSEADELENGYSIESQEPVEVSNESQAEQQSDEFEQVKRKQANVIEWYQVGKDGNCYLMRVNSGVTDVVSAVPSSKCS